MSSNATNPPISTKTESGVLVVTIDREEAGNSLSLDTIIAIRGAIGAAGVHSSLRGIVITGAGDRFFCSGGDIKAYRSISTKEELARTFGAARDLLNEIESHELPIIAAINGYALGGGAELALACDMRFASADAQIGFPQSRLGLIPGWNGVERLVRIVGRADAMRMLLAAERLTALQAVSKGLVDEVPSNCTVLQHSVAFLSDLSAAPLAISSVKRAVCATSRPDVHDVTAAIFEQLWFTEDHREAEAAFAEKRSPVFRGR